MREFDVLIIGAGGAGLMCAFQAGKRGRKVALLDHSDKAGAKILISGGGRCNFTNLGAGPGNYVSQNPHFCKSALSRFTPADFIQLVKDHRIPYHEKKLGQLFCDRSAKDIVEMLLSECEKAKVKIFLKCACEKVGRSSPSPSPGEGRGEDERQILKPPPTLPSPVRGGGFLIKTNQGEFSTHSLVVATGGLSIPKVGATDFGYRLARQFGLQVVETAPALDGFRFSGADLKHFGDLTGVSCDAQVSCGGASFRENILLTHAGLSGPAALQASLYWHPKEKVEVNFLPDFEPAALEKWLNQRKGSKSGVKTLLSGILPKRLAERLCEMNLPGHATLAQLSSRKIKDFCAQLQSFTFVPQDTIGYGKAEVTRGGVDTNELSSKTMESKKVPGLYFIGEVVDVTGQLGGYNFQWAWSSAYAAAQAV